MKGINRIGLKLGAVIAALLLMVILVLGLVIDRAFTNFYHNRMSGDVDELARHFASMAQSHGSGTDELIHMFAEFSNVSISMTDMEGKRTAELGKLKIADTGFITPQALQTLRQGQSSASEYTASGGERYFVSAYPIREGEHGGAALFVLSSMRPMDESLGQVRLLIAVSAAVAFALAIAFSYAVSQIMSRPLVRIERATRSIARGNLEERLTVGSRDEIGALAEAINDLARDLQHIRDTRQEFFANISHELRTPITYMEGYANVVREELYETEEEKRQFLGIIQQEARKLNVMIHDLFELSKMEEGKIDLAPERLDISGLVRDCVQKAQLKAREKQLLLVQEIGSPLPAVQGDALRLEQVMTNLLDNAIRYTEAGEIRVRAAPADGFVEIAVQDTGIGIPEEELPYIFERFYRVEKSRSREYGGTGLGLAIARKLAELHGGELLVWSKPGTGTRFTLRLPAADI